MNKFAESVESLLSNINLVEQINTIVKQQEANHSWQNDEILKCFIQNLPHAESLTSCNLDDDFLELINTVNNKVITKLTEEESKMPTDTELAVSTKLLIAAGALSLIGIALYAYYSKKNDKEGNNRRQKTDKKQGSVLQQQLNLARKPESIQSYGQYQLLLVIEANRLEQSLKEDASISKNEAEKVISNATFGYCFLDNDAVGEKVLEAVDCPDGYSIKYETAEKVFIQLSLSAKPKIATEKLNRLSIIDALNPNAQVTVKKIKKLQTSRSIMKFYNII